MKIQKLALIVASLSLSIVSAACSSSGGGLRLDGSSAPDESKAQQSAEGKEADCIANRNGADFYSLSAECQAAINSANLNRTVTATEAARAR